ncbi:MAG: DUF721 domain-containing protein [Chthonomonas sp.]|nr:DUF721 domain-containing protein [Chthonomonas sp.]
MLGDSVAQAEVLRAARAQQILRHWPEVVGEFLASKCVPDRFERGTLWIAASGSAWAQELRLQQADILAKLNAYAGTSLFLALRIGTRTPRRTWEPGAELA